MLRNDSSQRPRNQDFTKVTKNDGLIRWGLRAKDRQSHRRPPGGAQRQEERVTDTYKLGWTARLASTAYIHQVN